MNQDFSIKEFKQLLSDYRINEAMEMLQNALMQQAGDHEDIAKMMKVLDIQKENYFRMSDFLLSGQPDPYRGETFRKIVGSLQQIGEGLEFLSTINDLGIYSEARRIDSISPQPLEKLLADYKRTSNNQKCAIELGQEMPVLQRKKEDYLRKIYKKTWVLGYNDKSSLLEIENLSSEDLDYELMTQVIAGLTMGTLHFYDKEKLITLINLYDSITEKNGDERVLARLLISIVLIMDYWKSKIKNDTDIRRRMEDWNNSIFTYTRLRDVILTLIKTKDTDRVSKKIKEDIIPRLMDTTPEIFEKLKDQTGAIDLSDFEGNPEWEKIMKESGLESKLMELNEMQLAGMDVMMQAFSQLKTFPFFREAANWFLPFMPKHTELSQFKAYDSDAFRAILSDGFGFCDGDKYSFVLSLCSMPAERAMMLSSQMSAGMEQMNEELKSQSLYKKKSIFLDETVKYCRDLYRFFRLFPRRRDYPKIFSHTLEFLEIPFIGEMMTESEVIETVAEFYFKNGYYKEALSHFNTLSLLEKKDRALLEKIGYCYQIEGNYRAALENYEKAELFTSTSDPASLWLLNKMAFCHKVLGNYQEAARLYKEALEKQPDDHKLKLNYGHLMMNCGEIEEALNAYYTVNYRHPDMSSCTRAIIRAEMKSGNYDKARQFVRKLLSGEPNEFDYKLSGHLEYITGNYQKALDEYKKCVNSETPIEDQRKKLLEEMEFLQGTEYDNIKYIVFLDSVFH